MLAGKPRDDRYPSRHASAASILPRTDPVVYSASHAEGPLAATKLRDYAEKGFVVLDNLFADEELAVLQAELTRLKDTVAGINPDFVIAEPGASNLRSIFEVHEVSLVLGRLARDARLVRHAEYILGDRVYIHQSRLNYKPGFFGKEFYWHSDFETWHVEDGMPRMRALSVSISLSENTEVNGPLMLIPGSHHYYVPCVGETPKDHYRESLRKQQYGVPDPEDLTQLVNRGGIHTVTGSAGKTVLFDCNTMHGSNSNITPHPRSNVFIVYNSVSNAVEAPYGPDKPRPAFLAERACFDPIDAIAGPIQSTRTNDSG